MRDIQQMQEMLQVLDAASHRLGNKMRFWLQGWLFPDIQRVNWGANVPGLRQAVCEVRIPNKMHQMQI
jgi:hypothetical protein